MIDLVGELRAVAESALQWSRRIDEPEVACPLDALEAASSDVARAWSGSSFGYHSRVYYDKFAPPPPGAHFSSEWGLMGVFQGTTGKWVEYAYDDVIAHIRQRAGDPNTEPIAHEAEKLRERIEATRADVVSILHSLLAEGADEFLESLRNEVESLFILTKDQAIKVQMPHGDRFMSRDSLALSQGLRPAPHQEVLADVVALRSPCLAAKELATLSSRAAAHVARRATKAVTGPNAQGSKIFIGHGRSLLWRELKDFLQDRLRLPWEEFNRVPVAGVTNIARLAEMLDGAGIAFLVLTAEDERVDGEVVARQNVVHEAGLFQGRLGFSRAILVIEEGCSEFSNIQGLGQLRFPPGHISAIFEDVRQVLEREGFLDD